MIATPRLKTGMYLVGRDDGTVDPFFARVSGSEVIHHIEEDMMNHALSGEGWWWRLMHIPLMPMSFDAYPDNFKECP